jgi:hypothetical protein
MLACGGLIRTIMTDAVPPGLIHAVLTTVIYGIAHLFGFGDPPSMITA